jgi:hypothetical protein
VKLFTTWDVEEALAHAAAGGQALHLHAIIPDRKTAPRCFVAAVDRGEPIAHLFDRDRDRLIRTAKRLGVKVVYVDRDGTDRQHIDLCAGPLRKAYALLAAEDAADLPATLAKFKERDREAD